MNGVVAMEPRVKPQIAATLAGRSRKTLANWRSAGVGPPWVKVGQGPESISYPLAGLMAWLDEQVSA